MNIPNAVIYMADDDADDRYLLLKALQQVAPFVTVIEAENGADLLALLVLGSLQPTPQAVHLILIDMNMPRVNGLEALMAIKANPALRHIPSVMISTSAEQAQVAAAYQQGINGYIKKPVTNAHMNEIAQAIKICFLNATVGNLQSSLSYGTNSTGLVL
ncbi:response regulator [Spirosoma spitsbergense]|jgi:CheY-like chemotaxis protein|uniref:response regulator n=1 Tax=Spirosoma spitsbergense TaxID=431554 RepID=UPI000370C393|nr:response regulator [Spirosoma spitsbergense]